MVDSSYFWAGIYQAEPRWKFSELSWAELGTLKIGADVEQNLSLVSFKSKQIDDKKEVFMLKSFDYYQLKVKLFLLFNW